MNPFCIGAPDIVAAPDWSEYAVVSLRAKYTTPVPPQKLNRTVKRLSFSKSESALALATKSNGKPSSVRTGLCPDLQMRLSAESQTCGNTIEIIGTSGALRE
jgi:hypothetical protein